MKIKSIQAGNFGCFKDLEIEELDTNVVVVYGQNEAGKSTFFNLVETLFYGWRPVVNNPYLPWEGSVASFTAKLVTEDAEEVIVERSLRSRAQGKLIKGETSYNLGNKRLEMLSFLPRALFSEVYCLTLGQLRFPDAAAWQELQEQLLGGQYASFLRPVSEVISELESEANGLWRPDRRGKPLAKLLQEQILDLTKRKKKAVENEKTLREMEQRLVVLSQTKEKVKEEKIQLLADLHRVERLLPVKKRLQRIEELLTTAGAIEDYQELPVEPEKYLRTIEDELQIVEEKMQKTVGKKKQLAEVMISFDEKQKLFIAQSDEVEKISKAYSLIASDQQEVSTLQEDLRQNKQRLVSYSAPFLLGGWQLELEAVLQDIDEEKLQAEIASLQKAQNNHQNKVNQWEGLGGHRESAHDLRFLSIISVTSFLLGLGGIWWLGNSPLGFAAALVLLFGLGLGVYKMFAPRLNIKKIELEAVGKEVVLLQEECQQRREKVKEILRELPLTKQRLETLDETLWVDVKNMKMFLAEKIAFTEKLQQVEGRLQGYEKRIEAVLERLQQTSSGEMLSDLRLWEKDLRVARESQTKAQHAQDNYHEVEEQLAELRKQRVKLIEKKEVFLDSLQSLAGENFRDKIANVLSARDHWQQAQTLRKDLEKEYPDWQVIKKEIEEAETLQESWLFSDRDLIAKKVVLRELEEQGVDLKEESARLETELKHLTEQERLDDLTGAMQQLQEERKVVAVKRDRLVLLKEILQGAERSFREEHQPDVLQKTGHFLEIITGGRYDRLFVQDDGCGLMVRSNYTDQLISASFPLSRGTLEQIYLALRLALTEHLDSEKETVPLFLDEVLVNWDEIRLERGLAVIQELAKRRQVFLFTCHAWLVKKIQKMTEVKVIDLN